jgi:hypothetical protein
MQNQSRRRDVRIDFRSGGWVILLAILIVIALVAWHIVPAIRQTTPYGAAQPDVPFNGFDPSTCLVPRDQIVTGMARDTLLPLDNPPVVPADQLDAINKQYRKYLLPGDRVIGVAIGGQARAYPLRVLDWHEVCNDTVAGQPIAVTYSPLCDSAVVFRRVVSGQPLRFGVSGLLYNSNLLMYDTAPAGAPSSLWSQLQFRAITGPAAAEGAQLVVLPAQVVYWADWQRQYPDTTVLAPDPAYIKRYNREPYSSYFGRAQPRYPIQPLPIAPTIPLFEPVIAVRVSEDACVYPFSRIAKGADALGRWTTRCGDAPLHFDYRHRPPNPATVEVGADAPVGSVRFVQSFWFAWHAMHPQGPPALETP